MKTRYIVIPVVILSVAAIATWILVHNFNQKPKYDLWEVRRGAVARTVSVSGSVISGQKFELGFLSPGIVQEVKVSVGDRVQAGDLLVAQDTSVLREQVNQARAGVAAASAMLNKTRNHLRPADLDVLNRSLDNARVALDTARKNLQDAYRSRDTEINNTNNAVAVADRAYQNALNTYNAQLAIIDQSTVAAQIALNNATNALSSAQNNYSQILNLYNQGRATFAELQQAQSILSTANNAYLSARVTYDTAAQQANLQKASAAGSLDIARSQLDSARLAYNSTTTGLDIKINIAQNSLAAAEATYNLMYAQYQQSLAPALGADIASASASVAASAASVRVIEAQIAKAFLKAPIDGLITVVNAKPHELSPMTGPAVTIETVGNFQVESFISEVDVDKIVAGQAVKLTFDALPNINLQGIVISIDPAANIILGVVNYKIKLAVPETEAGLKPEMTADAEILVDQRDNVLFLPRKALTKADGGYQVKVLGNRGPEERLIQIGLLGDSEAEIVAGLAEGEKIILREL